MQLFIYYKSRDGMSLYICLVYMTVKTNYQIEILVLTIHNSQNNLAVGIFEGAILEVLGIRARIYHLSAALHEF